MSKKNTTILVIFLLIIALLVVIYLRISSSPQNTGVDLEKSNVILEENEKNKEQLQESEANKIESEKPSHESRKLEKLDREACLEFYAYTGVLAEIIINHGVFSEEMTLFNAKLKKIEEEYGITADSDEFFDQCDRFLGDGEFIDRITERAKEINPQGEF